MKLPKRIEDKINKNGPNGCWLWTGSITRYGYGQTSIKHKPIHAHRVVYEHLVGPIPDGLQIDHLCRVRSCVNPDHLEAVTSKVNIQRGDSRKNARFGADYQRRKTHCKAGHPYDEANTYFRPSGGRACRACWKRYRANRKQQLTTGG